MGAILSGWYVVRLHGPDERAIEEAFSAPTPTAAMALAAAQHPGWRVKGARARVGNTVETRQVRRFLSDAGRSGQ